MVSLSNTFDLIADTIYVIGKAGELMNVEDAFDELALTPEQQNSLAKLGAVLANGPNYFQTIYDAIKDNTDDIDAIFELLERSTSAITGDVVAGLALKQNAFKLGTNLTWTTAENELPTLNVDCNSKAEITDMVADINTAIGTKASTTYVAEQVGKKQDKFTLGTNLEGRPSMW